jgi:tetratricopeptide (TPR) repeat protein
LDLVSGTARRLHWFRVVADAKVELPAGRYRFSMTVDDGARLWVDGRLVFSDSDPTASRTEDAEVDLAGRSHHLRVEFFQEVGGYRLWLQVAPRSGPARTQAAALGGGVPAFDFWVGALALETARNPADPRLATERGEALGLSGRFLESADEYARATQLDPAEHLSWYSQACLLGYSGESDKYREVCQAMVLRFGSSSDGETCQHVANSCMLLPDSGVDPKQFAALLDRALASQVPPHLLPSFELSRGVAEYRAGHFDSALVWLDKAHDSLSDELASSLAIADFFTTMSQERLGRSAEAHAAFQRASALVESRVPQAGVDDLRPGGLENWLICQCARHEAQHLLALRLP